MIHKVMEEFYVFASSEDSLEHFGDYSAGQFRAVSANVPHERQMGVCAIERFFCTGVRNTHQKGLHMRGFRGKLLVRQKLVPTGSPIRRHPARRSDGRDLRTTDIPRDKTL
jgi:hypothetical protein